jgi:hypothetical protein
MILNLSSPNISNFHAVTSSVLAQRAPSLEPHP